MFWRRRKLPANDEPLVPHGLIWQATETEGSTELPPDMWDNSPKEVQGSPAEPVEMPVGRIMPEQAAAQSGRPAPNQGKISPPILWPCVDDAEIARRAHLIDTAVSFPYRKPLTGAAVPNDLDLSEPESVEPAKLELVGVSPSPPIRDERTERIRDLIAKLGRLSLSPVLEKVRKAEAFTRMRDRANSHLQATSKQLGVLKQNAGPALGAAKLKIVGSSKMAISQSRSGMQRVTENISSVDLGGPVRIWNRIRSLQVKVRIPASNRRFFGSIVGSIGASWARVKEQFRRDSRAWESLGMAALSAIFALVVISGLRHYGPEHIEAQPVASPTSSRAKSPAPASAVIPTAVSQSTEHKPSPIAGAAKERHLGNTKALPVQEESVATPGSLKKKPRRHYSSEEDYVAKDTYVFYGNAAKHSR